MKTKPYIPTHLKVLTEDGPDFVDTFRVLREPELQERCLERRELRRIMKIVQKRGMLPEQMHHGRNLPRPRTRRR